MYNIFLLKRNTSQQQIDPPLHLRYQHLALTARALRWQHTPEGYRFLVIDLPEYYPNLFIDKHCHRCFIDQLQPILFFLRGTVLSLLSWYI
jgi:hypothetical protein